MKKLIFSLVAAVCLVGLFASACPAIGYIQGSGDIVEKSYDFKNFNRVEISSTFEFDISHSENYSLVISTRENIVSHLDIVQSGQTLKIRLKPGSYTNTDLKATLTMPELSGLTISGASRGGAKGFKSTGDFTLAVSGASTLDLDMEAGKTSAEISGASKLTGKLKALDTRFAISGASRCELVGSGGNTVLDVSGASQANLAEFPIQNTDAKISGASRATVNTGSTLNADVSGASTLEYLGNPTLGKVSVTGASRLISKS